MNTTLPGIFSIRPVFGLGAEFALGLGQILDTSAKYQGGY